MLNKKIFSLKNPLLLIAGIVLIILAVIASIPQFSSPILPSVSPTQTMELEDQETVSLTASPVAFMVNGQKIEGYGYNNQFPGPLLKVKQGTGITVDFQNNLDEPTTVHWHGLRLENRFDGVPHLTQKEVLPGESFEYKLIFPDPGVYWYHPHVREDAQQEKGLYGAMLVESNQVVDKPAREEVLILDDILLQDGEMAVFDKKTTNFAVMGRYGNTYLINGQTNYNYHMQVNEMARLYLINAANARPYKVAFPQAQIKAIGGDAGQFEKPFFTDNIVLGPSERSIIDIQYDTPGIYYIQNMAPQGPQIMGTITVSNDPPDESDGSFQEMEENVLFMDELQALQPYFAAPVEQEYDLFIRWPVMDAMIKNNPGMTEGHSETNESEGIEWEDSMAGINEITNNEEVTWILRDKKTGKENMDFEWTVKKGDIKKVRITNIEKSAHPMQHPIHIHGNRFLVLSTDGKPNDKMVWKDTVLIPKGKTIDLLVEFSNPGKWMIHCHTAEHLSSGMMSVINVEE